MKYKILLINLDSSNDRLQSCQQNFSSYGVEFERVSAINGKELSEQDIAGFYDQQLNITEYKKSLNKGELGCYLSHIKCWQKIVDEKLDYAVILEDDAKISGSFEEFEKLISRMKDWDFIRLAFVSKNIPIIDKVKLSAQHDLVSYKKVPINMLAQAVSYEGAKKLLAHSKSIYRPVDVDMKHYWEKQVNVVGIEPAFVQDRHDSSSVIDKVSGVKRKGNTSFIRNLRYVLKYKVKRKYYGLFRPNLASFVKFDNGSEQ